MISIYINKLYLGEMSMTEEYPGFMCLLSSLEYAYV